MHYTVVHEQDEQIGSLQLAPVTGAEGRVGGCCPRREAPAVRPSGAYRAALAGEAADLGRRSRAGTAARRINGVRRYVQGARRVRNERARPAGHGRTVDEEVACEPAACSEAI